jgi:hypothetical protein
MKSDDKFLHFPGFLFRRPTADFRLSCKSLCQTPIRANMNWEKWVLARANAVDFRSLTVLFSV